MNPKASAFPFAAVIRRFVSTRSIPRQPVPAKRVLSERLESRQLFASAQFTIVVLPDTQIYSQSFPATFNAQTQWIVDHRASDNIVFVTQEGDIVQSAETGTNRNLTQWTRADAAFDRLDGNLTENPNGLIPYSVSIGNHDFGKIGVKTAGNSRYLEFFGPQRYAGRTWFGGASASGLDQFQIFQAGERKFMNISLEWEPNASDLAWAQSVITAHPGLPTIITTHSYLNDATKSRTTSAESAAQGGLSGEKVFQNLVKPNPQVFMVLNGHFSGEYHQTSLNAAGQPVFEMVTDFQSRTDGGQGFMPLITFDPSANKINIRTYSPLLNQYETDSNSQFSFSVNFNSRFGVPPSPLPLPPVVHTLTFRTGENGYTGTVDTSLKQASPTTVLGSSTDNLLVDAATNANETSQVLIRFDRIIGSATSQIPAGARILSAELVLDTNNLGDGGAFHPMLKSWTGANTWASSINGIQADGKEAATGYSAQAGSVTRSPNVPEGKTIVNVTKDVQSWVSGSANYGWAILPWAQGSNGWGFSPSEAAAIADRPLLKVEWVPAEPKLLTFQTGAGYTGTADTVLAQATATTVQSASSLVTVDGPTANDTRVGLLKFSNLFGTGKGQIAAGASILWAKLYLDTPSGVTNAAGGGATFYQLKKSWSNSATWGNSFGGNGVQTNGVEAAATPDFNTGPQDIGTHGFDVTQTVRAWTDGAANHGWAIIPNSTDAWMFSSSESEFLLARPRLVVAWR